jgi:hypothetical protein
LVEPARIGRQPGHHRDIGIQRQTGGAPCRHAAIEHNNALMPKQAQQPPQARSGHAAISRVVDHHGGVRIDAPAPQRGVEGGLLRQRMTALPRGTGRRRGEILVKIGMQRTGQMAGLPGLAAGRAVTAADSRGATCVDQTQPMPGVQPGPQRRHIDQHLAKGQQRDGGCAHQGS